MYRDKNRNRTAIACEALEGRQLLTISSTYLSGSNFVVNCNNYSDNLRVTADYSYVYVRDNYNGQVAWANRWQVGTITINTNGGNDYVNAAGSWVPVNLYGGSGHDTLIGSYYNDFLSGSSGNDALYGHYGNDTIYGGSGRDRIDGYYGIDFLVASDDYESDDVFDFAFERNTIRRSSYDRLFLS